MSSNSAENVKFSKQAHLIQEAKKMYAQRQGAGGPTSADPSVSFEMKNSSNGSSSYLTMHHSSHNWKFTNKK